MPRSLRHRLSRFLQSTMLEAAHFDWAVGRGISVQVRDSDDWRAYNEIFVNGEYDTAIACALARRPRAGEPFRFVDLGAHRGFFSLRLLAKISELEAPPRVIGELVEPDPANLHWLQRRLAPGCVSGAAVHIRAGLAGRRSGDAAFELGQHSDSNRVTNRTSVARGMSVSYVDLEELLSGVPRVDLLKCDIEGAEFDLIREYPGLLRRAGVLVVEFHHDCGSVEKARASLAELGLREVAVSKNTAGLSTVVFEGAP